MIIIYIIYIMRIKCCCSAMKTLVVSLVPQFYSVTVSYERREDWLYLWAGSSDVNGC